MNNQIFKVFCKSVGFGLEYYIVFNNNQEHDNYLQSSTNKFSDIDFISQNKSYQKIKISDVVSEFGGRIKENALGIQLVFHFKSGAVFAAKRLNELFARS